MTPRERVLVVSVDGLAPRWISPARTPRLCGLAQQGAASFAARTIVPPVTLPAHASMLRGVGPEAHGVRDNTPRPLDDVAPSFLQIARDAGCSTVAIATWAPLDCLIEPGAARYRSVLDGGDDPAEDELTMTQARAVLADEPDLAFVYLEAPDLVGHAAGWDSEEYGRAVEGIDAMVGELIDLVGDEVAVVVTTDHGGIERDHQAVVDEVMDIFVIVRSNRVDPSGHLADASIVDTAPTVADLLGLDPPAAWTGHTLVDRAEPMVDVLMDMLAGMVDHTYGEDVDMLAHSLQTAACARAADVGDELVLAGLLHDIGHLLDDGTEWGLPQHDRVGARFLRPWLPAGVVEPIANHVDAKRALVTIDPDYHDRLSRASVETLRQQGGPFSDAEVAEFLGRPGAEAAMALRRFDDDGKVAGVDVRTLDDHRELLVAALTRAPHGAVSAAWARDSCRCDECVDPGNGQRLVTPDQLVGWRVVADTTTAGSRVIDLTHEDGTTHRCLVAEERRAPLERTELRIDRFGADERPRFLEALAERGAAIATGVPTEPGEVLRFGGEIGFVRETNYGDLFDVVAEPDPINLAYTPKGLPLHTDNPYRDPVPTVQLLHCLRAAADGGASRFADGWAVADAFRAARPDDFAVLATTPVTFRFAADGVDLRAAVPVITTDPDGMVTRVTINNRSMAARPAGPGTDRWYEAYVAFCARLEAAALEVTLAPGELIAFDNRRVLHGRAAFAGGSGRHLQGCYIDIDAVRSAVAVARG